MRRFRRRLIFNGLRSMDASVSPPSHRVSLRDQSLSTVILLCGLALVLSGCQSGGWLVKKQPDWSAFGQTAHSKDASQKPSERTMQTLRQFDLAGRLEEDPEHVLRQLQAILRHERIAGILFAHAELANMLAEKSEEEDEKRAFDLYVTAAADCYEYLFDDQFAQDRNAYDPQFRKVCDVYNESLDRAMRLANRHGGLKPGLQHFCHCGTDSILFRVHSQLEHLQRADFEKYGFTNGCEGCRIEEAIAQESHPRYEKAYSMYSGAWLSRGTLWWMVVTSGPSCFQMRR